jgi:hypothetical protein
MEAEFWQSRLGLVIRVGIAKIPLPSGSGILAIPTRISNPSRDCENSASIPPRILRISRIAIREIRASDLEARIWILGERFFFIKKMHIAQDIRFHPASDSSDLEARIWILGERFFFIKKTHIAQDIRFHPDSD